MSLPVHEPVTFAEFTKQFNESPATGEMRGSVVAILKMVHKLRQELNERQLECDHPLPAVYNVPQRRVHQCTLCGLQRTVPFGRIIEEEEVVDVAELAPDESPDENV